MKLLIVLILLYEVICHVSHQRSSISHVNHNQLLQINPKNFTPAPQIQENICENSATCVSFVQCPAHVRNTTVHKCKVPGGRDGVCCKTGQNHSEPIEKNIRGNHAVRVDHKTLGMLARRSREEVAELRSKEVRLLSTGRSSILFPGSASYSHFRNSRMFNMAELFEVMDVASRALEIAIATRTFKDRQGISNQQLELGVVQQDLRPTPLGGTCNPLPFCDSAQEKYRRIDGTCNNLLHTSWGSALTPYARLLPPVYHDGVWTPRTSVVHDQPLTSPRLISTTLFSDVDVPNYEYTLMVMQFGQFLSHDITQSIDTSYQNGSAVSCCSQDGNLELDKAFRHYACMPIEIPSNDPFYSNFGQQCMNFVRSVLAPNHDCTLGYAQQMNKITHFIDGSSIYGSTPEQTGELRSFESGKLNVFEDFGRDLLPLSKDPDACLTMEQGSACFTSGDTRTNQMISLMVLHTIFMREHNRIATELLKLNPYWSDEKLFLETRQIVMAEMQVIIYKEFLPTVIGIVAMEEFQLLLHQDGNYAHDYDPNIEPSITNEFASAALRFGHSTVDGLLKVFGSKKMEEVIAIPEVMFHPSRMRKKPFMDQILSTLTTEPIQEVDSFLAEALTKYMFRGGNPFGVDLASLNIQRGRDHGIRPYNHYRQLVGLPVIKSFEEFGPELSEKLRSVYASVDDIDLWVGGLLEEKAPGALVGYTFRDIIADQFYRLKKGDRYFFENDPNINPGFFTPIQLTELRKASLSRIICDNSDRVLLVRQALNAFRKPGVPGNEFVECDGPIIPKINLIYWQQ